MKESAKAKDAPTEIAPTSAESPAVEKDEESEQETSKNVTEESASADNEEEQQTQAVEGPDGDVILVPETQGGQSNSAKANNKSSTNEDSTKSVPKEQNAGQQDKANADTTGQSVELPMVPTMD